MTILYETSCQPLAHDEFALSVGALLITVLPCLRRVACECFAFCNDCQTALPQSVLIGRSCRLAPPYNRHPKTSLIQRLKDGFGSSRDCRRAARIGFGETRKVGYEILIQ
jgi:hypothetical protein